MEDDEQLDGAQSEPCMDATQNIVKYCEERLKKVLESLAQKRNIYKEAKLHPIGSAVCQTDCKGSDVDFLLEISRFVKEGEKNRRELFHFEDVEGADLNLRFVRNSEEEYVTTDQLYIDLESGIHEILDSKPDLVVSKNLSHGGFAAKNGKFSGVRCNGPAVTLLFKDKDHEDITCDLTIGLRLPEEDSAYERVVRNVAKRRTIDERKFRKDIIDKGLFVVPLEHRSRSDKWSVTSAVIEPWLIDELGDDVKIAIREFKNKKDELNVKQRDIEEYHIKCDSGENLYKDVCEYRNIKNPKEDLEKKRKYFSTQLSRGHLDLLYEQSIDLDEPCAKHFGSINSSAIKFAAIEIFLTDRSVDESRIINKLLGKEFKDCLLKRDIPIFSVAIYAEENKEVISKQCYDKLRKRLPNSEDFEDSMDTSEKDFTNEQRTDLNIFDATSYRKHQEDCQRRRVTMKEEPQSHQQNESSHPVTKVYIEGLTSYSGVDSDYDIKSFNSVKGDDWGKKELSAQSDAREAWRTSEAIKIELHTTLQGTKDLAAWIEKSDLFLYDFSVSTLKLFAREKSSLFATDIKGRLLLHWVACYGDEDSLEMIVKEGVDVDTKDKHQVKVPLHYATLMRNTKIVDKLLEYGADLNAQDALGKTPLHHLCEMVKGENKKLHVIKRMLQLGADLNAQDALGKTPLHYLCEMVKGENEMLHVTRRMLKLGADIGIQCNEGFTPVHSAINTDNEILDLLLEDSTRKDIITNGENHYLTFAILQGQANKVRSLLNAGADMNGHPNDIYPPLHLATIRQEENIINILLEKGIDVDKRDKRGKLASYYVT